MAGCTWYPGVWLQQIHDIPYVQWAKAFWSVHPLQ